MFCTPVLIRLAPHFTAGERLLAPLTRLLGVRGIEQVTQEERRSRHVVVIGYGVAGKLVGRALAACSADYLVLEMNAETVRRARSAGEPVYYADATSAEALAHANVAAARAIVVLINDPQAATRVVDTVRRVAPGVPVIIRTRYQAERSRLNNLGAADVVVEEVEASVEVMSRLLRRLEVPRNVIVSQIRAARDDMQTSDRKITLPRTVLPEHEGLADLKIDSIRITEESRALGCTSIDLDVRRNTRALIVAIRRGDSLLDQPSPDEPFAVGDIVYLVGSNEAIRDAVTLLDDDEGPGALQAARSPSGG